MLQVPDFTKGDGGRSSARADRTARGMRPVALLPAKAESEPPTVM